MESMPKIFGHGLPPEELEKVAAGVEKLSIKGLEPIDGEIEKSKEVTKFIELAGGYLNEELESFGREKFEIDSRRIHILFAEDFEKKFPKHSDSNGIYKSLDDGIYVKGDGFRLNLYKCIFHELVHQASFRSVYADKEERSIDPKRVGYADFNPTEDFSHEHFRGLNEAVVDKIVSDLTQRHADEIVIELNITEAEKNEPVNFYIGEMQVLKVVVEKIAETKGEDPEVVLRRFKQGEFSGEMMHLRDVEKAFGKGSLRVLAALRSGTKGSVSESSSKILKYFQADTEVEREKIAREILIERERLRYNQQRVGVRVNTSQKQNKKSSFANFFGLLEREKNE